MQTTRPPTLSWPGPSPVTIFLRNIRLLQLDQQPDWPGLSRKLFSSGQKAQTQRVKSLEWVLYQLFLLWDPSETKNKLRPFFPPLEPLQSVNLRAALFRALSDLKKNGDLGRETTVRKTMLDDCRGPKFEEVLAVFSTAVLRKVICDKQREPGLRLAFTKSLADTELEEQLIPLIIAHHSSLSTTRREQVRIRETHDQFSNLLEEKIRALSVRSKQKSRQFGESSHFERLTHDVKANWLGGRDFADILLTGGSTVENDAFLELPFEKAWSRARKGAIHQISHSSNVDLLQDLDACLANQRRRLQRLKEFRKSIQQGKASGMVSTKSQDKSLTITFKDHQALTVASTSKLRDAAAPRNLFDEHQAIISSLRDTLSEVKGTRDQGSSRIPTTMVESPQKPNPKQNFTLSPIPDTERYSPSPSPSPSVHVTDYEDEQRPAFNPTIEDALSQPLYHQGSGYDSFIREEHGANPPDHKQSERPPDPEPDSDKPLPRFEPRSLLERTRQSMSLLPPPPTSRPPRQSLAARRESERFPINQFATPPKEQSEPSRSGASTPRDDLFTEEAEYASIFKSRPRVAHSPLMSPAVHVGFDDDDDGAGADADDYVEDNESVLDLALVGSPLASKRR
ncbi:uncharacterized protein BHQ10_006017 [Talaromyces amestolkiae]|uniref:HAUS augmin-like complex subunit 6 N-terminal domain-containing protein n=1 Tax=Talaromyces amestolkiae TaxID=1196081 RepID=A0A364L2I0_TALAM|nr:uncharacterized protein BHQ10_006017 [Talaromyces amestolkiae]RAO70005.1 hypothetical protein BHQ10_006017 [Talaromyces amestolkiae]